MVDLSVNFVGIELCSPLIVASAGITEKLELLRRCREHGAGGAVMKSLFEKEICRTSPTPRFQIIKHELPGAETFTLYSYEQASEWDVARYAEEVHRATEELSDFLVIPSINCYTDEGWASYAQAMEQAGARAIELNTSCPHGSITFSGHEVEETIFRAVRIAREAVSIPIIVKISPMLTNPGNVVAELEKIGVQGGTIFNRMTAIEIDVEQEKPVLHGGYAGHGGPWAIHYPLRWISQIAPQTKLDIAGSGGVATGEDVVKYLLAGATVVQTCTAVVLRGYEVLEELRAGLERWMEGKGYRRLAEFRGKICAKILDTEEVDRRHTLIARVQRPESPPCEHACPVGTSVQGYISHIAHGRFREALRLAKERNPFPAVCGRVCHAPCEGQCTRAEVDDPLAIRELKRFVADLELKLPRRPTIAPPTSRTEKVAIVGGGPAGLTAARELRLMGYPVTVFEALPELGGMMVAGIPPFRLPREVIRAEIQDIVDLGVEVRLNTRVGRDVQLGELEAQGFRAILLATGAHRPVSLDIPGVYLPHVLHGVEFLRRVNLEQPPKLSGRVAVIGGGDVAFDAARCAVRCGAEEVTIYYRRSAVEMPASPGALEEAEEEGVAVHYLCAPTEIASGTLRLVRMRLGEPDELGRARPIPVRGSEFEVPADWVILAIGQAPDLEFVQQAGVELTEQGTVCVDQCLMSTKPGIFAAGDAATGAANIIEAIAGGWKAARYIDAFLRGEKMEPIATSAPPVDKSKLIKPDMVLTRRQRARRRPGAERARDFAEVSLGFTEELALAEARRCLGCAECAACGLCARTCIYSAIVLDNGRPTITDDCDGCGLCVYLCPNEAIAMVARERAAAD